MTDGINNNTHFKYWLWPILVCTSIAVIVIYVGYLWFVQPTSVYLVRHAEKGSDSNPSLTQAGQQRAQDLATLLRSADLDAAYSTDYCRTAQTAQPTAQDHNLSLDVMKTMGVPVNFTSCTPEIQVNTQVTNASSNHAATVANHILNNHTGSEVLVVGHSNTIPEIVKALGADSPCPDLAPLGTNGECYIPNQEYDNLFVVTVYGKNTNGNSVAKSIRLRYGVKTP